MVEKSAGKIKFGGVLINPELIDEDDAKEYGEAVKQFFESVNTITNINSKYEELTKEVYEKVYGKVKEND